MILHKSRCFVKHFNTEIPNNLPIFKTGHNRGLWWNCQKEVTRSYVWCCTNVQQIAYREKTIVRSGRDTNFLTDRRLSRAPCRNGWLSGTDVFFSGSHFFVEVLKDILGNVGNQLLKWKKTKQVKEKWKYQMHYFWQFHHKISTRNDWTPQTEVYEEFFSKI